MIIPTIGRIVWYWGPGTMKRTQPQAAVIAWVISDELVNLGVFDQSGRPASDGEQAVQLWQGEGERPDGRFCEWMPYQIGQAKKELHPVVERIFPSEVGPARLKR